MKLKVDNTPIEESDPITYFEIYEDSNIIIYELYNYRTETSNYEVNISNKQYIIRNMFNESDYNIIINYISSFNIYNINNSNRTIINLIFSDSKIKKILGLNLLKNII